MAATGSALALGLVRGAAVGAVVGALWATAAWTATAGSAAAGEPQEVARRSVTQSSQ